MSKLFYYNISKENSKKIYSIDSNILINMSRYFYNGHCHNEIETKNIVDFILLAKKNGWVEYEDAIIETCFNYTTNCLEPKALNGYMNVIDNLIMYETPQEVIVTKSNYKPDMRFDNTCNISSILNCTIVNCFLRKEDGIPNGNIAFYSTYLYNLKLLDLNQDKLLSNIEKLKNFYHFMATEIGYISGLHLILAQMLFIGNQESFNVAQKILKPKTKYSYRDIINSTIDMLHIQITFLKQGLSYQFKPPCDYVIVTQDIGLIELCKMIERIYMAFGNENSIAFYEFKNDISEEHCEECRLFYESIYEEMKKRVFEFFIHDVDRDKIMDNIIEKIPSLEKSIIN